MNSGDSGITRINTISQNLSLPSKATISFELVKKISLTAKEYVWRMSNREQE
jgi:hypothetical protein